MPKGEAAIEEFARMIALGREIQKRRALEAQQAAIRERAEAIFKDMPTEAIKRLWDEYDGANEPGGFMGEDIHMILNLRGESDYCAV